MIRVLLKATQPTAQALRAEVAATAASLLSSGRRGLATCFHAVPFQCTIMVWVVPPVGPKQWLAQPTAQALRAEVAATPLSAPILASAGLGIRVQAVPFQCRITVCGLTEERKQKAVQPTAQALRAEVAATLLRVLPSPGLGLGTRLQVVPFQCKISVLRPLPKPWKQFPA